MGALGYNPPPPRRDVGCLLGELQSLGPGTARDEERIQLEQIWTGSPSTSQSNTLPEASVSLFVNGEKSPKGMERWDCPRQRQSQVWPQIRAMGSKACCTPVTPAAWPQAFGVTLRQDISGSSPRATSPSGNRPLSQTLTVPRSHILRDLDVLGLPCARYLGSSPQDWVCPAPRGTADEEAWLQPPDLGRAP